VWTLKAAAVDRVPCIEIHRICGEKGASLLVGNFTDLAIVGYVANLV
jgi:hypothetical protein